MFRNVSFLLVQYCSDTTPIPPSLPLLFPPTNVLFAGRVRRLRHRCGHRGSGVLHRRPGRVDMQCCRRRCRHWRRSAANTQKWRRDANLWGGDCRRRRRQCLGQCLGWCLGHRRRQQGSRCMCRRCSHLRGSEDPSLRLISFGKKLFMLVR